MRKQIVAILASVLFGAGVILALPGCATFKADVKMAKIELKADMSACAKADSEDVHKSLPLIGAYAVCEALHASNSASGDCSDQAKALLALGKDAAVQCGLAAIQKADQDATAAASK